MELRRFAGGSDYERVSDFLIGLYLPGNRDGNWFQAEWEYAYTHPWFDESSTDRIGIWEDEGRIVGVVTYELRLGTAGFQTAAGYGSLKPVMLSYAEANLARTEDEGQLHLKVWVNDFDDAFEAIVAARGYVRLPDSDHPMSQLTIPNPFPRICVPDGFLLQSLADENDLYKVHRVLYRGFNHPGEPTREGAELRRKMQSGPHFRKDLTVVAVAPSGDYASYGGTWYDALNRFGYVEPVATDPDYRRQGLGTAVVMEGIRRCGALGATVAYVGSDQRFYLSMGFRRLFTQNCWVKHFDRAGSSTPRG
jgi:predicted N-acetyltransferase YhbS